MEPQHTIAGTKNRRRKMAWIGAAAVALLFTAGTLFRSHHASASGDAADEEASSEHSSRSVAHAVNTDSRTHRNVTAIVKRLKRATIDNVGDAYLQAHRQMAKANELAADGDIGNSLAAFQNAADLIRRIGSEHQEWHPSMVARRRDRIDHAMGRLRTARPEDFPLQNLDGSSPTASGGGGSAGDDLGSIYLSAYMLADEATGLADSGKAGEALVRLEEAEQILRSIQGNNNQWRPEVVDYRTRKVGEAIARLAQN